MASSNNALNNTVGASISGVTNVLTITNQSNTASSQAEVLATVGGASAGDAFYRANINGVTDWAWGADNSDLDKWKLSQGAALGTNDTIVAFTNGAILKPRQPAFLATLSVGVSNVTGDGTFYQVIFDNVIKDIQSNYNNATGVFTAPISGFYLFFTSLFLIDGTPSHTGSGVQFVSNSNGFFGQRQNYALGNFGGDMQLIGSMFTYLSAGDTMAVVVNVNNGTKTIDIAGAQALAGVWSSGFGGTLIC